MSVSTYPISVLPVSMDAEAPTLLSLDDYVIDTYPAGFDADESNFNTDAFKLRTTAGKCLEFFNGRLYMAIDNFVYCTKAHDIEHYDIRYCVVAGFSENVTMIARVVDGLYISTASNTYFLKGMGPSEKDVEGSGFQQIHLMKYGAIYGTVARFQSDLVPDTKTKNTTVLWASTIGVVAGSDGGNYTCLSLNQITMPTGTLGTSIIREDKGIYQYIVCFNVGADLFVNIADTLTIDHDNVLDTWVVNTITGSHSRYTNYLFNSFFKFDEKYYGSNATGLYELTGDTDFDGLTSLENQIDAFVLTPVTDFNKEEKKQVYDAFINARTYGDIYVEVIINETIDESVENNQFTIQQEGVEGVHRRRVKLPVGLQGTAWQFKIGNYDGCYFKIFDFEVNAKTLQRII